MLGHKSLQSHRSAWMHFAIADADLGSESVSEAIGKPGRSIVENAGRIDLGKEFFSRFLILGHYCICMVGAILVDMSDCLIESVDYFDGYNQIRKLNPEIFC